MADLHGWISSVINGFFYVLFISGLEVLVFPFLKVFQWSFYGLNDIVGNRAQINKMRDAFRLNNSIIILGVPGSGKTTVAHLLCTDCNTLVVTKENIDSISAFIADKTITSFFDKRRKAIIFDDIDILIHNDKTSLSFFIRVAQDTKSKIPCIFTCNQNDEKKICRKSYNIEMNNI